MNNKQNTEKFSVLKKIAIALLVIVFGTMLIISLVNSPHSAFRKAKGLIEKGEYSQAYTIVKELSDKNYAPAVNLLDNFVYKYERLTVTSTMRNGGYVIQEHNNYTYTNKGEPLTQSVNDGNGNLVSYARWDYNEDGFLTLYVKYDQNDNLTARTEYDGKGNQTLSVSYYSNGNLKSRVEYNEDGKETLNVNCTIDGLISSKTERKYDDKGSIILETRSSDSTATTTTAYEHEYDSKGNVSCTKTYVNEVSSYKTTYEYNDEGINTLAIMYDTNDRIVRRTEYSNDGKISLKLCYDENGNVSQKIEYNEDGNTTFNFIYNPQGEVFKKTEYKYNEDGKFITETYYDENDKVYVKNESLYNDNGILVSEIGYNEDGSIGTQKDYDQKGNLTLYASYVNGKIFDKSEYQYDENGNMLMYTFITYNGDQAFVVERSEYEYNFPVVVYVPSEN